MVTDINLIRHSMARSLTSTTSWTFPLTTTSSLFFECHELLKHTAENFLTTEISFIQHSSLHMKQWNKTICDEIYEKSFSHFKYFAKLLIFCRYNVWKVFIKFHFLKKNIAPWKYSEKVSWLPVQFLIKLLVCNLTKDDLQ